LWEDDIDGKPIAARRVGILGYGNQGRAQALNLRDSAVQVKVGLRPGSRNRSSAAADGIACATVGEVAGWADVLMLLVPDEHHRTVLEQAAAGGGLAPGKAVGFAHGFNVTYGQVEFPPEVGVFLVAPCSTGERLREAFRSGGGVFAYVAIHQDPGGHTRDLALAYARALGCARAGVLVTTFRAETEVDLFGEQAVLCGGVHALLTAAFDTLVEAGYPPEMAYLECHHQLTHLAATVHDEGIGGTRRRISSTALYGDLTRGPRVVPEPARAALKSILAEIRSGAFAREFLSEMAEGGTKMREEQHKADRHLAEDVGERLRALSRAAASRAAASRAAGNRTDPPAAAGASGRPGRAAGR
jgi:ketol-acid reductoisomerase